MVFLQRVLRGGWENFAVQGGEHLGGLENLGGAETPLETMDGILSNCTYDSKKP